jgi:hypothetical protein
VESVQNQVTRPDSNLVSTPVAVQTGCSHSKKTVDRMEKTKRTSLSRFELQIS